MINFFIDQKTVDLVERLRQIENIKVREVIGALNVALASREVRIESKQDFDDFLQQVSDYQEQDE
ncbi:hypothetical protein U2G71_004177 [Vibrio vulnificus]|uniref:Uncharacterized protein n=1 Tax=Vibrio vulnificus TaxID=672 RepID=A0ABX4X0N3_VIBVL|nr:hypothetical protein [Vibrio vulnificus]ELV8813201.1 hypothetical protein [Vibrio vulnificus]EMA2414823.1 hypothetical protein [Vibrio vulnificus]KHF82189.1 hypothetical protein OA15_20590 [Vibrio vulnificus]KHF93525.1 hypothetical protein OA14_20275 [Vibrio vulnificus]MCU8330700.1 hypothetical protein [Vibrio vulnificus]